ncbi:enoyl-CoA hydratase/isomerase family protein [Mycetocola manganoxydans]|uniref:3-hydroxyisobutyryl-CoA hydrolase n=1 Tax=Mycetocola manganoxydans TaxID=699879 RepID=A0A3L6ZU41_9MICO|nr:enoyl-CoA hydratase/isomerase family protein [Mycetocola manganoxydans]RLP71417.1 enoyl-CoA hydratase/isomerase family protein [Mycetocola manganoxydans]GHD46390.1 putative enoyl-CoA hydratase [Mycetocola manganoxydans]
MGDLLVSVGDGIGHLTLNRPAVLNALTHGMILGIRDALVSWRDDSEVSLVVLDGAGDRGLCAGGDIRGLHTNALAGRNDLSRHFWHDEYELCAIIAEYPKPFVSIMDGITMGGGVGVSAHAGIRIVTERSRVAMPETRIGFSPDVGGTHLLARAPGELGTYLGLNAATMTGADALACGFADYYVPSERLPHLYQALGERADPGSPAEVVLLFDETPPPSELLERREWIDRCYSGDSVATILEQLGAESEVDARAAADELTKLSPLALTVALASMREARQLGNLRDCLTSEYRVSAWLVEQPDLTEGIRARVIDKDNSPRWMPSTLAAVPEGAARAALTHSPPRH